MAVLLLAQSTMNLFAGSVTATRRVIVIAFLSLLYYKVPIMSSYIGILPITHSSFSASTEFVIKLLFVLQTSWYNKTIFFSPKSRISCGFELFLFAKKKKKNPSICVVKHHCVLVLLGEKSSTNISEIIVFC